MEQLILVKGKNGTAINILVGRDYENFSLDTKDFPLHLKKEHVNTLNLLQKIQTKTDLFRGPDWNLPLKIQ